MKRLETTSRERNGLRFAYVVAIVCLIYGGVALVLSAFQGYGLYAHDQLAPQMLSAGAGTTASDRTLVIVQGDRVENVSVPTNATVVTRETYEAAVRGRLRTGLALPLLFDILGAVVSILAGLTILHLVRKRERKELRHDVVAAMVLPDEKVVLRVLRENDGQLTQSELVSRTGLSKVKIHRIVKRLEQLGVVAKHPYGMTNKIVLQRDLLEE